MKVVIADNAPAVCDRLSALVGAIQGAEIVGTAATGQDVLPLVEAHNPDVVILDIDMPEESGIEVLRRIKSQKLSPIVIMLTNHSEMEYRDACLAAGAELFLDKAHGLDQFVPLLKGLRNHIHALQSEINAHKKTSATLQQTSEMLRETMERLHLAIPGSSDGLWYITFVPSRSWHDPAQPVWYSSRFREMLGYEELEFPNVLSSWETRLHPDDRAQVFATITAHLDHRTPAYNIEYRLFTKSGEPCWFHGRGQALWGESGHAFRLTGSLSDINDHKLLEARLLQLQKMECLNQMACGVVHDLNNSLTTIFGYSELLLGLLSPEDQRYDFAQATHKESVYAAALTSQLLSFCRKQNQPSQTLNLNTVVNDLKVMLCRVLGGQIDVVLRLTPSLKPIVSNSNQIQQILMNLAFNARDAMHRRGTLTIETDEVELDEAFARTHVSVSPGLYMMLAVTDTGCGMDEQTKSRIFEPFFTTKGDQGTGLGLATVYGNVKQSQGGISVDSEPGKGTTFKVYFPCVPQDEQRAT
jgi:two-component system cell cycle sensor histidine kinase/response regulator CckA